MNKSEFIETSTVSPEQEDDTAGSAEGRNAEFLESLRGARREEMKLPGERQTAEEETAGQEEGPEHLADLKNAREAISRFPDSGYSYTDPIDGKSRRIEVDGEGDEFEMDGEEE